MGVGKGVKAKQLRIATKMYRAAYRAAFGESAFKPYTHIGKHLSEHQTRLQYDVKDYSAEAQEHQGKITKHEGLHEEAERLHEA
jgi:hypothetical protein